MNLDYHRSLLGIDVGSTHCKAGLFGIDGSTNYITGVDTPVRQAEAGYCYIDAEELWVSVAGAIASLTRHPAAGQISAIGVASMAETGVLIDRRDACPRSAMIPWFDGSAGEDATRMSLVASPAERFLQSGVYPSFKNSLAKILWLKRTQALDPQGCVWLSAADYIVYRLTGKMATDYSLAGRTYAFQIYPKTWDADWLREFNLLPENFPEAQSSEKPVGVVASAQRLALGLPEGVSVCVAGHDHICGALAVGAIQPGAVLDSMGTAESLTGAYPQQPLGVKELASGFAFGCHTAPGLFYWLGGLSSSGGCIEWLRQLFPDRSLDYEEVNILLAETPSEPGTVLFYPYLAGAGVPHSMPAMRGAFLGLSSTHRLGDLLKAVLEGTAFEVEFMKRAAERLVGAPVKQVTATGGGVRNRFWMQIKADVSGCRYQLARTPEAVLLGAAMLAGIGAGVYVDVSQAVAAVTRPAEIEFLPDAERHAQYRRIFEEGYLPLMEPLRTYYLNRSKR